MSNTRKISRIHIIGLGGIGSHVLRNLLYSIEKGQLPGLTEIHLWDDDTIELKNKLYTTYDCDGDMVGKMKVDVAKENADLTLSLLGIGVSIHAHATKMSEELLFSDKGNPSSTVLYICAIDGTGFRNALYNKAGLSETLSLIKNNSLCWLDLRSEGSKIIINRNPVNTEEWKSVAPIFKDFGIENASCQLAVDLQNKTVQNGNVIVATIALQYIYNIIRNTITNNEVSYVKDFGPTYK